jgi:hypothetical protein
LEVPDEKQPQDCQSGMGILSRHSCTWQSDREYIIAIDSTSLRSDHWYVRVNLRWLFAGAGERFD